LCYTFAMPFPIDDYTPHGYLNTPTHTRNLSPRGVLRSHGAGFRWHYPAHAGMYGGRRETYRAGFRFALGGALELSEFDVVSSPYHSMNLFSLDLSHGGATLHATFHLVGEHALCASATIQGEARLAVIVEYTRTIAACGEWGESGLVGRIVDGDLVVQSFEDGEAFVVHATRPFTDLGITTDPAQAAVWASSQAPGLPGEGFVTVTGRRGDTVALFATLGFGMPCEQLDLYMTRGKTLRMAQHRQRAVRRTAAADRARKQAEDDAFWARAPILEGDWFPHWRRGLVYDLETLRMMVRAPAGIYRHIWDAMQIQAPRVVLAEAAIDALLLAYADPSLAQHLLLGTFVDAPEPNVPCSREDGSYNMVAADGTVCGTAPEWGYPWLVIDWLASLHPNREWLATLYPALTAYLHWWLENRRDPDGWLVYACSWESGQDDSPRFGDQPLGGGHPVRHVRPVDLQAAFAHACLVMSDIARDLGRAADSHEWLALGEEYVARTDALWQDDLNRYADFDTRSGKPTTVNDVMLLAPVALGVARPGRGEALRQEIEQIDPATLTWPMFAWTAIEAALRVGLNDHAAGLAAAVIDRAYTFWDAHQAHPDRTLPGIACEYWPPDGRCGGEGYGWGAFTTHLLLHVLIGITPERERLVVRPNLPPAWRFAGRMYGVRLHWRGTPICLHIEAHPDHAVVIANEQRTDVSWGAAAIFSWEALNLQH
jgi:hypothetical protein